MKKTFRFGVALGCVIGMWSVSAAAQDSNAEKPSLVHIQDVENMKIEPWGDGIPAFYEDVVATKREVAPMTCAMFRMEKGKPLVYDYDYDDVKIIIEGSMILNDGKNTITANKGDVVYIPNGATVEFSATDYGVGWACGQR